MVIYEIKNIINQKVYIGKDTQNRKSYYGSGVLIKRAIKKYGKNNFTKKIIDTSTNFDDLSKKEIYWINEYKKNHTLYNITKGGDGGDTLSNHPNINNIKTKISKSSKTKGNTYEKVYGEEKSKIYKEKLKSKIHLSINSESSKQKKKQYWTNYWYRYKEKCFEVKNKLIICNIEEVSEDLFELFKSIRTKNNIMNFSKVSDFYNFFNDERVNILFKRKWKKNKICPNCKKEFVYRNKKEIYCSKKCVIRKDNLTYDCKHKKVISIDGVKYNSISEASRKLVIDRELIRYRLKNKNITNYLYL